MHHHANLSVIGGMVNKKFVIMKRFTCSDQEANIMHACALRYTLVMHCFCTFMISTQDVLVIFL